MSVKDNYTAIVSMTVAVLVAGSLGFSYSRAAEQSEALPELTLDKSFYYVQSGEQTKSDWLKSSDISLWFTENGKPIYSFETIQPFGKVDSKGQLRFWQGRYAYNSETKGTANFGLGWRKLSADKSSIVGFNTFYDYAFENNLSRLGLGSEYFHGLGEYRANVYLPVSGEKDTGKTDSANNILYVRAVKGLDYEAGTALAKAPWVSVYASGFYYDNKYHDDEQGYKLRSSLQITPRVSLEGGYIHSNLDKGDWYGKVMYQLADGFKPSLKGGTHEPDKQQYANDLTYKLLQKVERDNTIRTEIYTKTVTATGQTITIINDASLPASVAISPGTGSVPYSSGMTIMITNDSGLTEEFWVAGTKLSGKLPGNFANGASATINVDNYVSAGDTIIIWATLL